MGDEQVEHRLAAALSEPPLGLSGWPARGDDAADALAFEFPASLGAPGLISRRSIGTATASAPKRLSRSCPLSSVGRSRYSQKPFGSSLILSISPTMLQ